jgi:hypothetical protein
VKSGAGDVLDQAPLHNQVVRDVVSLSLRELTSSFRQMESMCDISA